MKRILITGAASGLGLALAKKYASEGWSVCIADIQDEEGIKIAAHLNEEYANDCFFQHLDITSDAQWQELVALISERWQGLDALVNNAGVGASGDIDTFSIKDFQWTVDINLMGAVKGCHIVSVRSIQSCRSPVIGNDSCSLTSGHQTGVHQELKWIPIFKTHPQLGQPSPLSNDANTVTP